MKKFFLTVLLALLTLAPNANAQDESYKMTIKLKDGTTFTVNASDLSEVSFGEGELSFSGENLISILTTIDNQQKVDEKQDEKIEAMSEKMNDLMDWIYDMRAQMAVAKVEAEIEHQSLKAYVNNEIASLSTSQALLNAKTDQNSNDCAENSAKINRLEQKIADLSITVAISNADIVNIKEVLENLQESIKSLQERINYLSE